MMRWSSAEWRAIVAADHHNGVERHRVGNRQSGELALRVHDRATVFCENVRMNEEYPLALRQADAARTDFALLEQHMEFLASRIARLPTRGYLCRTLLLATATVWALLAAVLLLSR
jgi:hypothetical protein